MASTVAMSSSMDDLGQRSQAVPGAGDMADNLEGVAILLMAHAPHKHGGHLEKEQR